MTTESGIQAGRRQELKEGPPLLPAVSSRDDPLVIDERAATEVVANVDGHLPGLGVGRTLVAPHDPVVRGGCSCGWTETMVIGLCLTSERHQRGAADGRYLRLPGR